MKKIPNKSHISRSYQLAAEKILIEDSTVVNSLTEVLTRIRELKQILNEITDMELNVTEDFEGGPDGIKEIEETTQPKSTL